MKKYRAFILLSLAFVVMAILNKTILNSDELLYDSLSEQLTGNQIDEILAFNKKWQWLSYLMIPIILFVKIGLITCTLYLGIFFFNLKSSLKRLFFLVTKAEFVFVIVGLIKLIWLSFLDDLTIDDVQYFYPLSALNIIGYEGVSTWFIYPLQVLNLFELLYWIVLAYLLAKEINITSDRGLKVVASSYGSFLLIWVVAVMFFTLNIG